VDNATRIERFQVPTIAQLADLHLDEETVTKLRALFAGKLDPCEASPKCAAWVRQCYNEPSDHDKILAACDELLGTCGVEALEVDGDGYHTDDGIRMCPAFSYCNAGDPYVATIARDHSAGAWVVACWGDLLEEYENENELGDAARFDEAPESCPSCGKRGTFTLESFERGEHTADGWKASGIGYSFVCAECNHHCLTADDFTPPDPEHNQEGELDV
jgi:hypothetical protein